MIARRGRRGRGRAGKREPRCTFGRLSAATIGAIMAMCTIGYHGATAQGPASCDADDARCSLELIDAVRRHASERARWGTPESVACLREGLAQLEASRFLSLDLSRVRCKVEPLDASLEYQKSLEGLLLTAEQDIEAERASTIGKRVFGGRPARICDYPDTVAIVEGRRRVCSGVLVDQRTVLTAAHCVCDLKLNDPVHIEDHVRVQLGTHALGDNSALSVKIDTSRKVAVFEGFNCARRFRPPDWGRDLALLFLAERAPWKEPPPPNCVKLLPAPVAPTWMYLHPQTRVVTIVGYGLTEDNKLGEKRYARVAITSKICGDDIAQSRFRCLPGRETVLADPYVVRDTCRGDSGGPVYVKSGTRYFVAAITSRAAQGATCGPGGVYSLITPAVVDWMREYGVNVSSE